MQGRKAKRVDRMWRVWDKTRRAYVVAPLANGVAFMVASTDKSVIKALAR